MWRRLLHRPAATHSPAVSWLDLSRLAVMTRRVSRLLLNVDDIGLLSSLAHWYVISLSPVDPPPLTSPTNCGRPISAACTYSMQQAEEDPRRRRREKAAKNEMGLTLL